MLPSHARRSLSALAAFCTAASWACGGGGDAAPTSPGGGTPTPVLTTISLTASTNVLVTGNTLQLSAAPKDQSGNAIAATLTWSSSNPAVATVSGTGLVTAVGVGAATVTASSGGVSGSYAITVAGVTPVLTSITITGASNSVAPGATLQLAAQAKDQNGAAMAATFVWSSVSAAVATVSGSGLVTGVAAGTTTIRATAGSVTGTFALTVAQTSFPLAATVFMPGLSFSPVQLDVAVGAVVTWEFPALSHNVQFTTTAAGTPASIGILTNTTVNRTFTRAGTFPYSCTVHPGMDGTVVVH
jgi:plastocyanin